jgi:hypothetical protein
MSLLTGQFRDSYTQLINNVVIPGAKEKKITSTAQVAAAAVESLTRDKASMLVFVNHHAARRANHHSQFNSRRLAKDRQ